MIQNQAAAIFILVYFWSLFPLGWLYSNLPDQYRVGEVWTSPSYLLMGKPVSRLMLAGMTALAYALWMDGVRSPS